MAEAKHFLEQTGNDIEACVAADVVRGSRRLLLNHGFSQLVELTLANGRRLDVAALGADGTIVGIEIKVSVADFKADEKWLEYLGYCDLFYFAVPPQFPHEILPAHTGLILADRYGGEIVRESPRENLHPSRRRAVTLRFAQIASMRLTRILDPNCM
jgi:hypothetical protein